jgi:glycosyltransferase involved in cell wall biosynthesis
MKLTRLYFGYKFIDGPWGGANSTVRALYRSIQSDKRLTLVDDVSECDVFFMSSLSKGPGAGSTAYSYAEIKNILSQNPKIKLVFRAVNLRRHINPMWAIRHLINGDSRRDKDILRVMSLADKIIFQSDYQKSFFQEAGLENINTQTIHNGANASFWYNGSRPVLNKETPINLLCSTFSGKTIKRLALAANISEIPNVSVTHIGRWSKNLDPKNVRVMGILPHEEMREIMNATHYFFHPAIKDICPNAMIESLSAGVPVIYNDEVGSSQEIVGTHGLALNEGGLQGTIDAARINYNGYIKKLEVERHQYDIEHTARKYADEFLSMF